MQLSLWCFLVSFDHPAAPPPPKQKSIFVKYFDFLDNLITCTKACKENKQTSYQPTPTTSSSEHSPIHVAPNPLYLPILGQYAVPTHHLMGTVNIWWGHTFSDWDTHYVVGTHITHYSMGTDKMFVGRTFVFLGHTHRHPKSLWLFT